MSFYKTRWFSRWARKQGVRDEMLRQSVREIREGLYEADLGGGLLKKRIARSGQGKSGGFRTIVASRGGDRCFFVYGFAKNEQGDMSDEEVVALKALARTLLGLSPGSLAKAEEAGEVMKVNEDA